MAVIRLHRFRNLPDRTIPFGTEDLTAENNDPRSSIDAPASRFVAAPDRPESVH